MGKGTVLFPDLGEHCEHEDCKQLDFLPFTCDGCLKVFCLEHGTYKAHSCPKLEHNSRTVLVCETCTMSIEKRAHEEDEKAILERHEKSGECDATKKHKPKCPVRRCKEVLTFSNTSTCKTCNIKVCLKHRFPSDHECSKRAGKHHNHPLVLAAARKGMDCRGKERKMPNSPPPVEAF